MNMPFKDLYRKYIKKGVPLSDFDSFKKEVNQISDTELWNVMTNAEGDSPAEINMPSDVKEQIRKNLYRAVWRRRMMQATRYAAMIALLIISVIGIFSLVNGHDPHRMLTAQAKPGNKAEITLPDGTQVQLNSTTTLAYYIDDTHERLVHLSGEAFFDVTKDPKRPFKVITGGLQIEVVGTSFNVNTHKRNIVEASLVTGRIKISGKSLTQTYILNPGEKAIYSDKYKSLQIMKADIHADTEWKNDYLIFDSEPLTDVIEKIERWYGVKIELRNRQIGNDLLSGSFRHESIQNVIRSLSLQYKFEYEINKNKITIY